MSATENFADSKNLLLTVPALILTAVCSILPFGKAEAVDYQVSEGNYDYWISPTQTKGIRVVNYRDLTEEYENSGGTTVNPVYTFDKSTGKLVSGYSDVCATASAAKGKFSWKGSSYQCDCYDCNTIGYPTLSEEAANQAYEEAYAKAVQSPEFNNAGISYIGTMDSEEGDDSGTYACYDPDLAGCAPGEYFYANKGDYGECCIYLYNCIEANNWGQCVTCTNGSPVDGKCPANNNENNTPAVCDCMPGCAECSCEGSWQTCDRCFSSHARVKQSGNQYTCNECGENETVSSDGSSCIPTGCEVGYHEGPCDGGCCSCRVSNSAHCAECSDEQHCTKCDTGYVTDSTGWNCVQGIANCETYGSQGYDGGCFGCASGYVVDKVGNIGKCMPEASCNGKMRYWVQNGECVRKTCSEAYSPVCDLCDDNGCTKCSTGWFVKNGGCTEDCGSGYAIDGDECYKCPSSCKECDASGACTECSGELVLQNGQCNQCSSGTHFENGNCVSDCPANCDSCTSAEACDTCAGGYFNNDGECVTDCGDGKYADGNTCKACDNSCGTCSGSGACDTCAEGLIKQGSSCVSSCGTGYYQDGDSCKACGANCDSCTDSSSCKTCASGFVEQQGKCRSECGDGWSKMGGWCNRTSYSPGEAASLSTNDNNNSFTIIFKK